MVRTVRGGEPQMAAKEKAVRTLFAETNLAGAPLSPSKTSGPAVKQIATANPPPSPTSDGPTVLLKPLPPPQPVVVHSLLKGSILEAGLPQTAKTQPVPAAAPRVEKPIVEEPEVSRSVVLQVVESLDLFATAESAVPPSPLDRFSAHLLNPPSPQFRLRLPDERSSAGTLIGGG